MSRSISVAQRIEWLSGVSATALGVALMAAPMAAAAAPDAAVNAGFIIPRADLDPETSPPNGVRDLGITGVGQVITDTGGGFVGTCTGTLVNPRMVIFAAHCVNDVAASSYGEGGTGIGVFFKDDALPGIRQWLGGAGGPGLYVSNPEQAYYNVNQVWYDERSLELGEGLNFLQADLAIATLDRHATGIPTWAMLFSPLTAQTHVTLSGYGAVGDAENEVTSGNFRRRAVENMLSVLGSLDDRDQAIFGLESEFKQSLYMTDFDDPRRGSGQESIYDFDIFNGDALRREGTTGPGDSGGPLIVDRLFHRKVVAGVLSGGSRFFAEQPFSTYGTHNFYQPLFLFWDEVVRNNPYVYAAAKSGSGDWFDPKHWVQEMDPNYTVVRNGKLVTGLPDTPALGVSGDTVKFGEICYYDDCANLAEDSPRPPKGSGKSLVISGGPGSTGFVPNNVEPNRAKGTKARYYDVTLDARGTTRLSRSATIDRLTLDGPAGLDIRSSGRLRVLSDFNQLSGWTNVDGKLHTGEALVVSGVLSGKGTFRAPWLTLGAVAVAPAGDDVGRLTVQGNLVMSNASSLILDVKRGAADQLRVLADASAGSAGTAELDGTLVFNKAKGAAPRHGESYRILTAEGGVDGRFDNVLAITGVLRPKVSYTDDAVVAELRAGSLAQMLKSGSPLQLAFANILDRLRDGSYANLHGLYGEMDWLDGNALGAMFNNLAPSGLTGALSLFEAQNRGFTDLFSGRLALLGSPGGAHGLQVLGDVGQVLALGGDAGLHPAQRARGIGGMGFSGSYGAPQMVPLPDGMSGFVSGGYQEQGRSATVGQAAMTDDQGERSWHLAMGLERRAGERLTLGFATAYASGESAYGIQAYNTAETRSMQSAFYGAYRFDGGAYVAALASAGVNDADSRRQFGVGELPYDVAGRFQGSTVSTMMETGVNLIVPGGLTLTPKAGLRHSWLHTDGFEEAGGDAALRVDARTLARMEGRLGFGLGGVVETVSGWTLTPQVEAAFVRNLSGQDPAYRVRFVAVEMESFALPAALRDTGWGEVRGGLRMERAGLSFGLDLSTDIGRQELHEDRARASVGFRF
ncbi:autotransporter domain-containing protein [Indioceanicola profundi]|uniref:autotransporter domain-containing protein n=1 Tax=Indioceanicola profundi TaxID=2220096 RepID=UPI000E6AABFD|nr:autotransporter domain-containing protein [Indioceanicola profundi]